MRRGGKPVKAKGGAKLPVAGKSRKNEGSRERELETRLAEALKREAEALEQQTATGEILRVISSSPTDVQPVFEAIVRSAVRLCDAYDAWVGRVDGDGLRVVAHHGPIALPVDVVPIIRGTVAGRTVIDRRTLHVTDLQAAMDEYPEGSDLARRVGSRTTLSVPLLREGVPIGVIHIRRREVRPFTDAQINLLATFAAQAVIAIENVRLFRELEARNRDLTEALEQQTATAEILRVISNSPTDVRPVFDAIVKSAVRLCGALMSCVFRFEDGLIHFVGHHNFSPEGLDVYQRTYPLPPEQDKVLGRALLERRPVNVADVLTQLRSPIGQRELGYRSVLAVPMLREGTAIGVIATSRLEPGLFPPKQVDLLKTFADQAVIAIENVRLFNDTKEALQQQTATADILGVIASSPTDLQPILDAVAQSAARLCEADDATISLREGDELRSAVHVGPIPPSRGIGSRSPINRHWVSGRALLDGQPVHVHDLAVAGEFPESQARALAAGFRTILAVPLLREGKAIGAIAIRRAEVRPFSDKHIALLQTFADQAVIAIENVRLFTELQEKNRALTEAHAQVTEAFEQQTATAEILRVISNSLTDVQPVFDTIARSAARLCEAYDAAVLLRDGDRLHVGAHHGPIPVDFVSRPIDRDWVTGRAVVDGKPIQVRDLSEAREEFPGGQTLALRLGHKAILAVPLLREREAIGAITIRRTEARLFSEKHVALLQTFADQAVIAIENVHLFKELEARTSALTRSVEQLTALGEVGRAVSSTLDLETVLTTIVARAVELSRLDGGVVFEYDEGAEVFVHRAATETGGALAEARRAARIPKGEGVLGQTAITLEPVQVPDITVAGAYESRLRENLIESGVRAVLAVPMVREGRLIGCLGVTRNRPGEFPAETIELLRTFATQSALAIQNARLYHELADKSRLLEAASRHKSEFLANMSHELRTPLNAIIGFSEVLAERMFGEVNKKQAEYLQDILSSGRHLLSLINDILDLSKVEAGRLELELGPFHLPTALDNALTLVRERASRHGIALDVAVDAGVGDIVADERKVKQILLNLLSNAVKFTPEGGRVSVTATAAEDVVTIAVSDTGIGIAPEDQAAIFEEFRQVGRDDARKQEGTGLGLTLAKKFVELHGGQIGVRSQVGQGSTFTFTLPVRPAGGNQGGGAPH